MIDEKDRTMPIAVEMLMLFPLRYPVKETGPKGKFRLRQAEPDTSAGLPTSRHHGAALRCAPAPPAHSAPDLAPATRFRHRAIRANGCDGTVN